MAIRLHKAFGGGAETWYRLQACYEMAQAMKNEGQINVQRLYRDTWTAVNEFNPQNNLIEFHSQNRQLGRNVIEPLHLLFCKPRYNHGKH